MDGGPVVSPFVTRLVPSPVGAPFADTVARDERPPGRDQTEPARSARLLAAGAGEPFLGALVVNLSGLIDHARHSTAELVASYAWFALVAFVVWEGNRRLYFRLPRREDWLLRPWSRLGVLLALISLYTMPMSLALLWIWRVVTGDPGTRHYALTTAIFAVVAFVVAITHVYETVFLLRDWESDRMRSARLEQARLETELESLGREVDPHFLFNNLNALAHLVDQRSDAAAASSAR